MEKIRGFEIVSDEFRKFPNEEIKMPFRATKKSAGYDFYSNEDFILSPKESHTFWLDLKTYMLDDEVLKIFVRSSIAIKKNLVLKNQVGIIDCVPEGTLIKTKNGDIEVEKLIKNKDIILSYNEKNKLIEEDELQDIFVVNYDELFFIETEEGDTIEIPENKEIYTERGWIKAKDLNINDKILKF